MEESAKAESNAEPKAEMKQDKLAAAAPPPGAAPAPPPPPSPPAEEPRPAPRSAKLADDGPADGPDDKGALLGNASGDSFGAGGLGLTGTGQGGGGTGEGIGLGGIGTIGRGGGTGQGQGYGAGGAGGARAKPRAGTPTVKVFASTGGLDTAIVTRVVRSRQAQYLACLKSDPPTRATIKFAIKPDGKVASATVTGATPSATACLSKGTLAIPFPTAKTPTTVSVLVETPDDL